MDYTLHTEILKEKDGAVKGKLDARVSEAPVKGFKFEMAIPQKLKAGDTIELIRLPNRGQIIGVIFENDFVDVTYSLHTSGGVELMMSDCNHDQKFMAPVDSPRQSVYLKITKGSPKIGQSFRGIVQFIGV